jgi:hypothetical protein
MECSPKKLVIRLAQLEDHDGILNMTREENFYGGMDYLPFALKNWLKEGAYEKSNKENFVFTLVGKIVGFVSIYFQNAGKVAVKFAFRVSKHIRGKGYGRQITILLEKYLKENHANLESTMSSISDMDLTEEEINSPKHGKLLAVKSYPTYKIKLEDLSSVSTKTCKQKFSVVSRQKISEILRRKNTQDLLPSNLLHMNWVPVLLETEEDIDFAVRKKQIILAEGVTQNSISSFSILTLPYSVPNGNFKSAIDIFTKDGDKEATKAHVKLQLMNMSGMMRRESMIENITNEKPDSDIFFHIFVNQNLVNTVIDVMDGYGLQKHLYTLGVQKRDVGNMYIFQKNII